MNWLKRHFFKITTVLLLLVSVAATYAAIKSMKIENHIFLPTFSYGDLAPYGYEYVTVKGTLISTGEDGIGSPLNTTEFTCDNSIRECNLVQAELFSDSTLTTYTESFPIESWDNNFIIFKTNPESGQCVIWTYRIDRVRKELIGVREQAANYDYDRCIGIGLNKFEVKVVDGWEVISKLRGFE
jgi:hypothetical protein